MKQQYSLKTVAEMDSLKKLKSIMDNSRETPSPQPPVRAEGLKWQMVISLSSSKSHSSFIPPTVMKIGSDSHACDL